MSFGDILALIRTILDLIRFATDMEKRRQIKKDLEKVRETIKPYILNRFVFRSLLFLDHLIFALVTALYFIYLDMITILFNVYTASLLALLMMIANTLNALQGHIGA